jgi:predicted nucleic acid-binding protein
MGPPPARPRRAAGDGRGSRLRAATLNAYFDTSAIVKLVVAEDGSELADELWSTSALRISSQLVYPEARAALAAAQRQGRIDRRGLRRAVGDLEQAVTAMRLLGVDHALAREAGNLAEHRALRGHDAVHLASALLIDDPELLIVTWDSELAAAARDSGHPVAPARHDRRP